MKRLILLILFMPVFCAFSQEKDRETLEDEREEIRKVILVKLGALEKKIDSLKIKLDKEKGDRKDALEQSVDKVEAKRKELRLKLEDEKEEVLKDLDQLKKDLDKGWEDLKDSFQNLENQLSSEQGSLKHSNELWR